MKKLIIITICYVFFVKTVQCVCISENNQIFLKMLDLECYDTRKQLLEYVRTINCVIQQDLKYLNTEQEVKDYINFLKHMCLLTENFYVFRLKRYVVNATVLEKMHNSEWNIWYDAYNLIQD